MINLRCTKAYCKDFEKIENYEEAVNDKSETWDCHHRLEAVFTLVELKRAGWYLDRKPEELIFIRRSEHRNNPDLHIGVRRNHEVRRGKKRKPLSAETKAKISAALKGKKLSEEHAAKVAFAHKGKKHTEETKRKVSKALKGNQHVKGKLWYNNGIKSVMAFECPEGFVKGRIYRRKSV